MILALLAWLWAALGPWVFWLWGVVAVAIDGTLKMCGLVWLGERLVKWWGQ